MASTGSKAERTCIVVALEVQPQRQLDLPGRSHANRFLHRGAEHPESATSRRRCKRHVGLQLVCPSPQRLIELHRRIGEVCTVKQVVYLGAELEMGLFVDLESLLDSQIDLSQ